MTFVHTHRVTQSDPLIHDQTGLFSQVQTAYLHSPDVPENRRRKTQISLILTSFTFFSAETQLLVIFFKQHQVLFKAGGKV